MKGAGVDLRQLARIADEDMERERRRREQETRLLVRYFAGDDRYGACPLPCLAFHRDRTPNRILIGGNKSAKTVAGAVDVILQCEGRHPYRRRLRPPLACRVVAPDLPITSEKAHPQRDTFRDWVPAAWLRGGSWEAGWSDGARTLHFANGSFVEFYSSRQDPSVHAGERRHLVLFDEEMPKAIYQENLARLAKERVLGEWLFTYVPVEGLAWIEDELYLPALEGRKPGVGLHEVTIYDNQHNLPAGFIEQLVAGLADEREVLVRAHGKYSVRSGRVYDLFGREHTVDGEIEVVVG